MASNSTTPSPPHLSTQELKNAAAAVVSERVPLPRPLRTSQSFRLDEGYSGEETPIVYDEASGQDLRAVREGVDFKIPPWMAGLNDSLREGMLVFFFFIYPIPPLPKMHTSHPFVSFIEILCEWLPITCVPFFLHVPCTYFCPWLRDGSVDFLSLSITCCTFCQSLVLCTRFTWF